MDVNRLGNTDDISRIGDVKIGPSESAGQESIAIPANVGRATPAGAMLERAIATDKRELLDSVPQFKLGKFPRETAQLGARLSAFAQQGQGASGETDALAQGVREIETKTVISDLQQRAKL